MSPTALDARAQLRLAAAGLCGHGVALSNCTQAHQEGEG